MSHELQFYIDGAWVAPVEPKVADVINPATEQPYTKISMGGDADVDRAVAAAKKARFRPSLRTPRGAPRPASPDRSNGIHARYEDIAAGRVR